jgi:rubredoxin
MKKFKCRACGFKFRLEKENRYLSKKSTLLLGNISEKPTIFEMFDCPQCGCQNAVGIYEKPIEGEINGENKVFI